MYIFLFALQSKFILIPCPFFYLYLGLTTESVFNVNFVSEGQTPQRGFFAYFTVGDASTSLSLSRKF